MFLHLHHHSKRFCILLLPIIKRNNTCNSLKKNPLLSYKLIAYGVTWTVLTPLIYFYGKLHVVLYELWHIIGSLGLAIAAILVIGFWKGKDELNELRKRCMKSFVLSRVQDSSE